MQQININELKPKMDVFYDADENGDEDEDIY